MTEHRDMELERDPEVGELLREHLALGEETRFIAGVLARIRAERGESSWDILARWAPLGMAATIILALGVGAWLGWEIRDRLQTPTAPVVASGTMAQWVTSPAPVNDDIVLAAVLDGDRWYGSTTASEAPR